MDQGKYNEGRGGAQDFAQAAVWFRKAAQQGVAESQANLGLQYAEGIGVRKDYGEALKWIRKSAEQNFADGQYKLGIMYLNGYGVSRDGVEGYKWIEKAAAQGHAQARQVKGAAARQAVLAEIANAPGTIVFGAGKSPLPDSYDRQSAGSSTASPTVRQEKTGSGVGALLFVLLLLIIVVFVIMQLAGN